MFKFSKSNDFNKEGASEALKSMHREFGDFPQKNNDNIQNNLSNSPDINTVNSKRLIESLPEFVIQRCGTFPEKLASYKILHDLTAEQKNRIKSALDVKKEIAVRRVDLLERLLDKIAPDEMNNLRNIDVIYFEAIIEAWGCADNINSARETANQLRKLNEKAKES